MLHPHAALAVGREPDRGARLDVSQMRPVLEHPVRIVHRVGGGEFDRRRQILAAAGWVQPVPSDTFYVTALVQAHQHDFREVMPVYASHGLKVADDAVAEERSDGPERPATPSAPRRGAGKGLVGAMMLALLIGYVISFASTLVTEYHYAVPKDRSESAMGHGIPETYVPAWISCCRARMSMRIR